MILRRWAEREGWKILEPPPLQALLATESDWLDTVMTADQYWLLPDLEHYFLRHIDGLQLVRKLLDQAFAGSLGRGIIACNSWAWAFLLHIRQGYTPVPCVLQSFDHERLARHFQNLHQQKSGHYVFRQSDDGSYLMPLSEEEKARRQEQGKTVEQSHFLQNLAAYSQGIPGVARALWRANLQFQPDQELDEAEPMRMTTRIRSVVVPWSKIRYARMPTAADSHYAFILHSLLLHGGLTLEGLHALELPLVSAKVVEMLMDLEQAEIICKTGQHWQVTPQAYPIVRDFLAAKNLLLDHF
ncbi:MAG: hypothetical protein R3E95_09870 [Thiolinea sp.]